MDKNILSQYIDACELIKETEEEIKKLNRKKKTVIQTNVSGSNPEFPYTHNILKSREQHLTMQMTASFDIRRRFWKKENPRQSS